MVNFTKSWPFECQCWVFSRLAPKIRHSPLCVGSLCRTGQQRLPGNKSQTTVSDGGRARLTQVTSPVEPPPLFPHQKFAFLDREKTATAETVGAESVAAEKVFGALAVVYVLSRCCRLCNYTTQPSIHYPSIPPSSNVFAPQGIIPPDSVTVEPPHRGCGWNTFPLTIFHLLPVCPTIASVTEAYLCLSAPDTSSQWLWCFFSNKVTVAAAAAKWFVA